ncbi:MAG: sigma-70 region 4 domain-containing protein, partial [Pirellulales bacterium]
VEEAADPTPAVEDRLSDREEVGRLLSELSEEEASIVKLYHLEGKSYLEISRQIGIPENSIGPTLSRARARLRRDEPRAV